MLDSRFIWFSSSNEDSSSEIEALSPSKQTSVLCITGSGSRPLDLLATDAKLIVAVDQNPAQTALAELKLATIKQFSYSEWIEFLGIVDSTQRKALYQSVRGNLSASSRAFWDNHPTAVEDGVLYCGKWERYFRFIRSMAGRKRRLLADRLFTFNAPQQQYEFWQSYWDGPEWRLFLRFLASRWLWRYFFREPGIKHTPREFSLNRYAYERFDHAARNTVLAESPFAFLIFFGRYYLEGALPWYLRVENFDRLKSGVDRISLITSPLQTYLESPSTPHFGAFSLSDFSSYCSREAQDGIWNLLLSKCTNDARICERKFVNKTESTVLGSGRVFRDKELERRLFERDHSFFYSFIVARAQGA